MLVPVILAGGIGSRLWPVSRALLPKQFIQFPQQQGSLFQNTLARLAGLPDLGAPLVVCNEDHRFLAAEQLRQMDNEKHTIILEPFGRNTAPAVALAALCVAQADPDAILLVLPSDHLIQQPAALRAAITEGQRLARDGNLVTFGIVPGSPQTGYGYIRIGDSLAGGVARRVAEFVEKPDLETARGYLASGDYLWNSGMFMFSAACYLEELGRHAPDMLQQCRRTHGGMTADGDFLRVPADVFELCPADSIDYAVMEKTSHAAVLPLDADWNDLGAWSAFSDMGEKDDNNNVVNGDVLLTDVHDSYVQAGSRLVTAVGLRDTVIVETSDAVLVAARDKVQNVKQIVDLLKAQNREEHSLHDLVYRPWGSYERLVDAEGFKVKHIVVKPGGTLSLQLHHHRSEHWVVIRGQATVTRDEEVFTVDPNESTFIPQGCKHRLENRGEEPCELIEVQVGSYLGEDDIVRLEDIYGRHRPLPLAEDQPP
ncbi:MAG: hypothetical protein RLZZ385_1550 [Pseudomonadota bacterium]|jgi:mannose-1-phosphate guanylyltransferase/mannose-6-phosphate isomerase